MFCECRFAGFPQRFDARLNSSFGLSRYRNESDGEFTNDVLEEAIEEHVREFCLSIRVNVNVFRIINIDASTSDEGSSAPTMLVNRCRRVVRSLARFHAATSQP